jgi:hypothetical protein
MLMLLSVSSRQTYVSCQRKFWHEKINKTTPDVDYLTPSYFLFGRAFEQCLEEFSYQAGNMKTEKIIEIANKNGLNSDSDIAKIMACLREYFSKYYSTNIIKSQVYVKNEAIHGYIDAISHEGDYFWLIENKTASDISSTIALDIVNDPQVNLYLSQIHTLSNIFDVSKFKGVDYRVIKKPIQKMGKKETMLEFTQRCKCDSLNLKIEKEKFNTKMVLDMFAISVTEIHAKKNMNEFMQNTRECVQFKKYSCPFYSQCHDGLFTNISSDSDENIDF